ncbi:hypothetical protein IAR55_004998 [Kwoniella newhampshirensis]|uniref:Uncharacterized protein n=1 Tax=Kwoniella newhampshirensis TaxID=1651941 RepID=A0AAW0YWF7_9TREE
MRPVRPLSPVSSRSDSSAALALDVGLQDAIPDIIMPTDLGDLLTGLGADDLDDFGDMDGGDIEDDGQTKLGASIGDDHESSTASSLLPPMTGFATAGGKLLAPPSADALSRARALWEADEARGLILPTQEQLSPPKKRPRLEPDSIASSSSGLTSGFITGRGVAVPPPSKKAAERAAKLFEYIENDPAFTFSTLIPNESPLSAPGSQLGSGKPIGRPSDANMVKALALFADTNTERSIPGPSSRAMITPATMTFGFQLGSGKAAPPPSTASVAKALSLFADIDGEHPSGSVSDQFSTTPASRNPLANEQPATPSRIPLATTTNTFGSNKKPIMLKTPSASIRRIGLGATPTQHKSKRGFMTPFKQILTQSQPSPKPGVAYRSVFDLNRG